MGLLDSVTNAVSDIIPGRSAAAAAQGAYASQMADLTNKIESQWQLPVYDQTPLTQQEYTLLTTYNPQLAAFVQQKSPQLLSQVSNEGTQAQQQALNQYKQLSGNGVDAGTQSQYDLANFDADQALRSRRANALNLLAQRGLGNSGATLNADIGAGIAASESQRRANLQAASDAAQRKVQAIQGLGNLGSQVASQKQQANEFDTNTVNNYNQQLANRQQQYQDYVANTQNQANLYNQQQSQSVANANTGIANQTNLMNRQRQDALVNAMANASNDKLKVLAGQQTSAANQQLNYANQQSQNSTNTFLGLAGIGAALALAPATGGASAAAAAPAAAGVLSAPAVNYGSASPSYGLGVNSGTDQGVGS